MTDRTKKQLPTDPSGIDEPHDVLAAEEFAMPTRASGAIPTDPIHEPHDVLAAEEFAMPAPGERHDAKGGIDPRTLLPLIALGAALATAVALRRARG